MNNELATRLPITIQTIGDTEINAVDARQLHKELKIGKDFSNWIKAQIERGHFIKHVDFEVFAQKGVNCTGGRPTAECIISTSMAKEICMMSHTAMGSAVRKYFLECERIAKNQPPKSGFDTSRLSKMEILEMAMDSERRATQAEDKINMLTEHVLEVDYIFLYKTHPISVYMFAGKAWFVAVEIGRAYSVAKDSWGLVRSVADRERGYIKHKPSGQYTTVVTAEATLELLTRARNSEAAYLHKWLSTEVLPVVRGDKPKSGTGLAKQAEIMPNVAKTEVQQMAINALLEIAKGRPLPVGI